MCLERNTSLNTTTDCLTNADGFTDDDVATRELALAGTPRPYDFFVCEVRKAYREGKTKYELSYGGPGGTDAAPAIKRAIEKVFTTSRVRCDINPDFKQHLLIEVRFPRI